MEKRVFLAIFLSFLVLAAYQAYFAPATPPPAVTEPVAPNTAAPMLLQQLADASRQEPGNLRFDLLQHTMRGNHFTVIEQWRDQVALDTHVGTPHARAYRDALQPLTGSPLDERVYLGIAR